MLALTPLAAAVMGGRQSAIAELLALVRALNGHIFAPGLETYADQLALNPAASTLDSQVGYVGSASTQGQGENLIPNSEAVGATPTTVATGWVLEGTNGITTSVVGAGTVDGIPYQDIRVFGTATGTSYPSIQFDIPGASLPIAFAGQLWSIQLKAALIAGSYAGFSGSYIVARVDGCNSSGEYIELVTSTSFSTVTNSNLTQLSTTGRAAKISSVRVKGIITGTVSVGQSVDLTIRVAQPQLERGHPTAYTPTYGTAISRGVFASAVQGTLANTPKLVTLGNARGLEFDGSTDRLVTDITTPSSGYVCVAFRQDKALGSTNCLIGCGATSGNVGGIALRVTITGNIQAVKYANDGTALSARTLTTISVGSTTIADMSWGMSALAVRLLGAGESSNGSVKDPTGTGIMLIGAQNQYKDGALSPVNYTQGAFGLVIIIPNVTLPAATEQRIRKLVGQIYGAQTQ